MMGGNVGIAPVAIGIAEGPPVGAGVPAAPGGGGIVGAGMPGIPIGRLGPLAALGLAPGAPAMPGEPTAGAPASPIEGPGVPLMAAGEAAPAKLDPNGGVAPPPALITPSLPGLALLVSDEQPLTRTSATTKTVIECLSMAASGASVAADFWYTTAWI
jgi:hypothetical protein